MGSYWRVLTREMTQSDLHLNMITLTAMLIVEQKKESK